MTTPTQGEHAQPEALRTIAEWPITDPSNMDAVNMAAVARAALTAAPGVQTEPSASEDMRNAVRFAAGSAYWSAELVRFFGPNARDGINALEQQLRDALAQVRDLEAALSAQPAAPQGGAYVENPAGIEHVAGDVSKNRSESNMKGGAYAELPASLRAMSAYPLGHCWDALDAAVCVQAAAALDALRASHGQAPADPDGEAFRTAAHLGLTLRFYGGCAQSSMPGTPSAYVVVTCRDRAAGMREAVQRAATVIENGGESQRLDTTTAQPAPAATPQGGASPATDEELDLLLSAARSAGYHAGRADTMRASHGQAPAGEVKPDGSIYRNSVTGEFELDYANEDHPKGTHADFYLAPTAQPAPAAGNWIAADDVNRLVRELDVCLNGEAGAAAQASLCDVVAQVRHETAKRGQPLFAAPAAGAVAGPALWVSPKQFAAFEDSEISPHGKYLPARKTSAGNFTMPLFAAASTPAAQGDALDRVTNFRHEAEGMVRGGEWVRLSDVRAALAQKEGKV